MEHDTEMYNFLSTNGFESIEIAPTRIFPNNPYENLEMAKFWSDKLQTDFNLSVSSVQSIWYGRKENIFASKKEKDFLLDYTKKAVLFTEALKCRNLVFGCPRNRDTQLHFSKALSESKDFFHTIGEFAIKHHTIIAIEANPTIYNTHFINYTKEAFEFVQTLACEGLKVNVDLGTIIQNKEDISILAKHSNLINHVHISEPNLEILTERNLHFELFALLKKIAYNGYVSIEMKNDNDIKTVKRVALYIKGCKGEDL